MAKMILSRSMKVATDCQKHGYDNASASVVNITAILTDETVFTEKLFLLSVACSVDDLMNRLAVLSVVQLRATVRRGNP